MIWVTGLKACLGFIPQAEAKPEIRAAYALLHMTSFRAASFLHVRNVSANHSDVSHRVHKPTNSVASRGVTAQECSSSTTASFRFASAGAVGV